MKINAVITKKPRIKMQGVRLTLTDKTLIIIAFSMLISIVSGALIYKAQSELFKNSIFDAFVAFSTDLSGKSFFEAFSGFFAVDLSVLLVLTVLGVSAFGRVPILALAVFRVVGIGTLGAYLFDSFGSAGFKYFLLVILPGKAFMFFALLLTVQNCFQTSGRIKLLSNGKLSETLDLKIFIVRNSVAAVIFALSAVIDTILLKFVSQYFLPDI